MSNEETPIFPIETPPVREGVYKIHLKPTMSETYGIRFATWKTGEWRAWQDNPEQAAHFTKVRSTLIYDSAYTIGWSGPYLPLSAKGNFRMTPLEKLNYVRELQAGSLSSITFRAALAGGELPAWLMSLVNSDLRADFTAALRNAEKTLQSSGEAELQLALDRAKAEVTRIQQALKNLKNPT